MRCLREGVARAMTAPCLSRDCSSVSGMVSASPPSMAWLAGSPAWAATAAAVAGWSPVTTTVDTPAVVSVATAAGTP